MQSMRERYKIIAVLSSFLILACSIDVSCQSDSHTANVTPNSSATPTFTPTAIYQNPTITPIVGTVQAQPPQLPNFLNSPLPIAPDQPIYSLYPVHDIPKTINIMFIAADDYGSDDQAFKEDVQALITDGFWENDAIASNKNLFNFWFVGSPLRGHIQQNQDQVCPDVTWPDLPNAARFATVYLMVHRDNTFSDCKVAPNYATVAAGNVFIVLHEFGHAVFGLPDEYCCNGGYHADPPALYGPQGRDSCNQDNNNSAWRDCQPLGNNISFPWWRSEGEQCSVMRCAEGPATAPEFSHSEWMIIQSVLRDLTGQDPVIPTVFAPTDWIWT